MIASHVARRLAAGVAIATLALGGKAPAQNAQPAPTPKAKPAAKPAKAALELPKIERFTLENGLEVAFLHTDAAPVVSVQVWYHAGSKDEPKDRRGSAHMFEHIMFKGTEHVRPEEHARHINRLGGYVQATTTEDATFFQQTLPAEYVDFALELEADRMRNLLFRKEMIDTEREVVKDEIRRDEQSPVTRGFLRFLKIAFTKHPYAWTSGGTIDDLDKTTPDDLEKFYDTYYVPNNAMVVVVGDVSLDEVKASVEKHFGEIAKGATPPRPADSATEPAQTEQRREVAEPSQIGLVITGYKIPEAKHEDIYALQVASLVLGSGESARLRQKIKKLDKKSKRPLGVDAGAQVLIREHPGLFATVGVFLDEPAAAKVEKLLFAEVAALASKGPTKDELRKAKNQIQSSFVFGLENVNGLASQIGLSWILTGDPSQFTRDLAEFEKVTVDDVKRVAKTYLNPEQATVVVIPPVTGEQ